MTHLRDPDALLVIYDGDCGICTRTAMVLRRLDPGRRLRLVAAQASADVVDRPPLEVLLSAIHVRDIDERWYVGGIAAIQIADAIPLIKPLALLARLPLVMRLVEWGYGRIAANRGAISRLLGETACRVASRPPSAAIGIEHRLREWAGDLSAGVDVDGSGDDRGAAVHRDFGTSLAT